MEDTNTASVTTLGDHADVASLHLHEVLDLAGLKVQLDGVVDLDVRVGVTDGAAIVGGDVRDSLLGQSLLLDAAKLEVGLLVVKGVEGETALGVVKHAEAVLALGQLNDICYREKGIKTPKQSQLS